MRIQTIPNLEFATAYDPVVLHLQGISILLAMVLRTTERGQASNYDSDDAYTTARNPLLNGPVQPLPYVANDAWTVGHDSVISYSQPYFSA